MNMAEEDENKEVPDDDPREGTSGLARGPLDWTRDQLPCCRDNAILFVSALEVKFTICALQKIFLVDKSGGLGFPSLEDVG